MIIYKATNLMNDKSYIGKTVESTIDKRKYEHIWAMKNKSAIYFHKALRRHGEPSFAWDILDRAKGVDELNEMEKYYISFFNTIRPFGYNLTLGGDGHCGYRVSEETKKKIQATERKTKGSARYRQTLSRTAKACMNRPEVKERLRQAAIERFRDDAEKDANKARQRAAQNRPEVKAKKSIAMKAHWQKHPEAVERLASLRRGKPQSKESNQKRSEALRGRVFSSGHRENIKAALARRRASIACS